MITMKPTTLVNLYFFVLQVGERRPRWTLFRFYALESKPWNISERATYQMKVRSIVYLLPILKKNLFQEQKFFEAVFKWSKKWGYLLSNFFICCVLMSKQKNKVLCIIEIDAQRFENSAFPNHLFFALYNSKKILIGIIWERLNKAIKAKNLLSM